MIQSKLCIIITCGLFLLGAFTIWKIQRTGRGFKLVNNGSNYSNFLENEPQNHKEKTFTIESRLAEANENWKRGVASRKKLEALNLLDLKNPWNYKNGISIWDFFYPNFDCPHSVERIGKSGDGGKWVCGLGHLAEKPGSCIVYSYGVSTDTSYEDEIVARTNCSVYLFDHTINITTIKLPKRHPKRAFIEKVGLGAQNTLDLRLRSISSTMRKYGHDFIDILKIDVEGAEFDVFDNFKTEFPKGLPFGQINIEIHLPSVGSIAFLIKYKWLTNLEAMGLRAFRNEVNLISVKRSYEHYPNLCEYSFINVNYDNYLLH